MGKKGASHIEMILSLVIFVTAVTFALIFFSPVNNTRFSDTTIVYTFDEIEKFSAVEVKIYNVILDNSGGQLTSNDNAEVIIKGVDSSWGVRVVDSNGVTLTSGRNGDSVYFSKVWPNTKESVSLMFSEEFVSGALSTGKTGAVLVGTHSVKKVLSEKKLGELKNEYESDYENLKGQSEFNLPNRIDFGFSLGSISAQREIPEGLEVFSEEKRVEVLGTDGKVRFETLRVEIW
jgi:hypothetical protein